MDFSSVCLDGMLGGSSSNSSNHHLKHHHVRSASEMDLENPTSRDHDWRSNSGKMARTESYIPALMRTTSSSVMSDASRMETTNNSNNNNNSSSDLMESEQAATARLMRSDSIVSPFSTSNKNLSLPFYHHHNNIPAAYQYAVGAHKSSGLGLGFHGVLTGVRMSPFTATQWQELEHQALILRYIMAGVQVPPELLIPIRKTNNLNCNLFSNLSGSLRPNLGWGSFHLAFGNNADPEPGRCRRTDGKKWRCSRDAVPDQKYCERHMNRGRHRSRKPVEGQTQTIPAAAATTTTTTTPNSSGAAISSATSLAAAARSAVTPNNTNTTNTNGNTSSFSNLRPSMASAAESHLKPSSYSAMDATATATPFQIPLNVDRYMLKGDLPGHFFESGSSFNDGGGAWRASRMVAPPPPPKTTTNLMGYQTQSLVEDAPDFGLGHMNLLPLRGDDSHHDERRAGGGGIRHFFDDWPMRSAAAATTSATATQLSISIPSDFSPASPNNKLTLSPLKLSTSRSDDPLGVDVALGVGMGLAIEPEHRHRPTQNHHSNWIPIAWESPVGGPLAEVLNSTALPHEKHNNSSSSVLNLMTGDAAWDCSSSGSPRGDNSPTGVLQKTLGSLSDNSSTGSSPRVLKPPSASASLCDNLRTAAFAQLSNT